MEVHSFLCSLSSFYTFGYVFIGRQSLYLTRMLPSAVINVAIIAVNGPKAGFTSVRSFAIVTTSIVLSTTSSSFSALPVSLGDASFDMAW
jgi:hypothetical protein